MHWFYVSFYKCTSERTGFYVLSIVVGQQALVMRATQNGFYIFSHRCTQNKNICFTNIDGQLIRINHLLHTSMEHTIKPMFVSPT